MNIISTLFVLLFSRLALSLQKTNNIYGNGDNETYC